ncbi:hypothetical protein BT96DRAFT_932162 [Gymnopus androsaceus JB14]|uniref:Uncharacterized protein n=1 Tax=Gymnopus androsaceus JB14 TaxID=1447944 RepID=A0A6A4IFP0_9AGAR|nr:hypothetical protein BT96DRAFT_932162 [Gymnopus androsaceus JB14]
MSKQPSFQNTISENTLPLMFEVGSLILASFAYGFFFLGTCIAISLSAHLESHDLIVEDATSDLELIKDIQDFFSRIEIPYEIMQPWPPTIILLLSDFIVTWRAWVLFQDNKFWRLLLLTMMVGNTFVLSFAVNVLATISIIWKAWHHHCFLVESSIRKKTQVQKILLLLIESGSIFCVTQAVYLDLIFSDKITSIDAKTSVTSYTIPVTQILTIAAAWYPATVVMLIHCQENFIPGTEPFMTTAIGPVSNPRIE